MAAYYFVGTFLPTLTLEQPPEITFATFDQLLRDNLNSKDYAKTRTIRRFFDILNLRALWLHEPFDARGEMSMTRMEEAIGSRVGLPDYVYEYIESYKSLEEKLKHFPLLLARFFQSSESIKDPFLRKYMQFERELRLVMTAFRAKKLGRDLSLEFQYEDPEEELIAQLLVQKDAKTFELPEKFAALQDIFDKNGNDPLALQYSLDAYRFNVIESWLDPADSFSIKRILGYLIQLILVENRFKADKMKGIQIIDTLVKER